MNLLEYFIGISSQSIRLRPPRGCVSSRPYSPECVEGEFCEVGLRVYGLLRSSHVRYSRKFPVGAATIKMLISFCPREEEAPRQTASSTAVVSIRLGPRGT